MLRRAFNKHLAAVATTTAALPRAGILDLMEARQLKGMIMGELDDLNAANPDPIPPRELVGQSVSYLRSIGVKFRT